MTARNWQKLDNAVTLLHAFCIRRKLRALRREGQPVRWLDMLGPKRPPQTVRPS